MIKNILTILLTSVLFISNVSAEPPAKPGNSQGGSKSESNTANISYKGATTISNDLEESNKKYSSLADSENTILVTNGTSTLTNPDVTKSGDASGDEADFYGTNAAILVKSGTLNIKGGNITTSGSHANGIFAYSSGIINISDTTINTSSNNSGAIMVTGGGTLTANNVTAETSGNSSAPIRSDRGGGTLTVNGGTYISHGTGSPVIYSTADIIVNDANLTSTSSEGVVVEGKNSVALNNVTMEATNTKLNGNSETYKSIFIYQSMSGDALVGTSSFTSKNSKIVNNKGEVIFVTNTNTVINLENNEIINNDEAGNFLKIGAAKWGNSGSNGGNVTLNLVNQKIEGNIIVDDISTLDLVLKDNSVYIGAIDTENQAQKITLTLSNDSTLVLTGDTYIDDLNNENSYNSNIYLNGYKLYVNGIEISANEETYQETITNNVEEVKEETNKSNYLPYYAAGVITIIALIIFIINKKKKV